MMIFTDGSALGNPGPGVVIKKNGSESTEIKIAHAVTKMGTSYQGEVQAIRIGTTYAKENIGISTENLHTYKNVASTISKEEIKQRAVHLKHISRLKSGHCMLKSHRSKINLEITPDCDHHKVKKTSSHLHCKVFDNE